MARQIKAATESSESLSKGGATVRDLVAQVIDDVRDRGDNAVREYSEEFDSWSPEQFRLDDDEVRRIVATAPDQVVAGIEAAQARVRKFARLHVAEATRPLFGEVGIDLLAGPTTFKSHTYQEVVDPSVSADLGLLCGRAARVELFLGHARSGDVRAAKYAGHPLPWAPPGTGVGS